jgi:hypothetical protein
LSAALYFCNISVNIGLLQAKKYESVVSGRQYGVCHTALHCSKSSFLIPPKQSYAEYKINNYLGICIITDEVKD